ncbi:putative Galactose oxidase [Methylorubrum extorquens AM1]|jgi:hypothetical protein|uniref:Galactose oxidase n=2 Tax=Methylorubrum extorquens TaxID=408 RepID=C5AX47_METEA|nr:putative Galactose oxidase [Methylorubrum extorquens AM1]
MAVPGSSFAQVAIGNEPDPLVDNLRVGPNASVVGMWSPVRGWPLVGIHATLMPSGTVMTYGTALGGDVHDGRTFDLWDPARGLDDPAAHYTLPNAQFIDSFCSAAAFLKSGAMLISGGSAVSNNYSSRASTLFDPKTATPTAAASQLAYQRWYASMLTLTDGRILITGGGAPYVVNAFRGPATAIAQGDVSMTPEIYTPGAGWSTLPGATSRDAFGPDFNRWWYPRMWVAPNGRVFGISADKMWSLDPNGRGATRTLGNFKTGFNAFRRPNTGPTSTAAMFDVGRILQVGGNGASNEHATPSSAAATVIDIRGAAPVLTEVAPMANPRQWANSTILPDGTVAVTGGTRFADNAGADAVYPAELWDPRTGRWKTGASAATYRGYHSAAVLLPNATVLVTGGGVPGPVTNFNAEIYYPPYLFRTDQGRQVLAPRPRVASVNAKTFDYGARLTVSLAGDDSISRVALVALGTATHSFDSSQRYIPAAFSQTGRTVSVVMPGSPNIAPPGYYMAFLLDAAGVPSNGIIVSIGGMAAPVAGPAGKGPIKAQIGELSKRVSRGRDGTTVVVNAQAGTLWRLTGGQSAAPIPAPKPMVDVAVVTANSIYGLATDGSILRYNGNAWKQVGHGGRTISASEDGTVAITNIEDNIYVKNADDDVEAWSYMPGAALRVVPMSRLAYWAIGMDGNVHRIEKGGKWTQVGESVGDLATAGDGRIAVTNKFTNEIWTKAGDDVTRNWQHNPTKAISLAVARGGSLITVGPDGNVYRE